MADAQSMQVNVRSFVLAILYVHSTKDTVYKTKHKHELTIVFACIVLLITRVNSHIYL